MLRAPYHDPHGGDSVVPHPDSWWDVAFGLTLVTALAVVTVGLLALTLSLVGIARFGEPPSSLKRRGPRITLLALSAATYLFATPFIVSVAA